MSDSTIEPVRVIGFVGLGRMGTPMATRLVEAGFEVRGFDVVPASLAELQSRGAAVAASAAEAFAGADAVILMLPDSGVVESVLADLQVQAALDPGTIVVDMSSSEPERTRALSVELAGRGVALVDAPVSGGVARAVSGELAIMAGGEDSDVRRVEPVLTKLGRIFRSGPVGSGHAVKALNNLMSATHLLVTSEAILAGERFGVEPRTILAIVNASSGRSGSTENKWPNFILPETYDSGFALQLMLKDMRIATGLIDRMQVAGQLAECAVEIWAKAAEELPPSADHTEIARWLRERAGNATA